RSQTAGARALVRAAQRGDAGAGAARDPRRRSRRPRGHRRRRAAGEPAGAAGGAGSRGAVAAAAAGHAGRGRRAGADGLECGSAQLMRFLLISLLLLLAACPEQTGLECPPNTGTIGQYALYLAGNHDAGECIASPPPTSDAGPLVLTFDDGGTRSAIFCLGTSDGGPELQMLLTGRGGVRKSPLLDDGGFRFVND